MLGSDITTTRCAIDQLRGFDLSMTFPCLHRSQQTAERAGRAEKLHLAATPFNWRIAGVADHDAVHPLRDTAEKGNVVPQQN